jgi:hypothetical protein
LMALQAGSKVPGNPLGDFGICSCIQRWAFPTTLIPFQMSNLAEETPSSAYLVVQTFDSLSPIGRTEGTSWGIFGVIHFVQIRRCHHWLA